MSMIETWQQAIKCPFCNQPLVSRRAIVCENPACLFKTVTYRVLMQFGQEAS